MKQPENISKTRQHLQLYLIEMESVLYALSAFDTPEINYIKQHIEQVVIHLNIITKNMQRLETADTKFWNALN